MSLINELLNEPTYDWNTHLGDVQNEKNTPEKLRVSYLKSYKSDKNGYYQTSNTAPDTVYGSPDTQDPLSDLKYTQTFSILKLNALMQKELPNLLNICQIIQSCNPLVDCQIITPIAAYSTSGLMDLRLTSRYFLDRTQIPLIEYLLKFLNYGQLDDKFEEFFIWNRLEIGVKVLRRGGIKKILDENHESYNEKKSTFSIKNKILSGKSDNTEEPGKDMIGQGKGWDSDIILEKSRIPNYIGLEMAQTIVDIGTMIRFLKKMKLDTYETTKKQKGSVDKIKERRSKEDRKRGKVNVNGGMELEMIPESNIYENRQKIDVEKIEFWHINPMAHLCNEPIKQFLSLHYYKYSSQIARLYIERVELSQIFDFLHRSFLFKNGDFIDELIDKMDSLLCRPAEEVYFHELMPLFREVTQNSSLGKIKNYEKYLDNFGVDLLLNTDGDCGWDVFSLKYNFSESLKPVIDNEIELMLQRLNIFLIKLRRIYYKMNEIWLKMKQVIASNNILKSSYNLVLRCNHMRTQMAQFITNLNSYIFYEVIASEYQILSDKITECESLPHLRSIVFTFLSNLLCKCYIQAPPFKIFNTNNQTKLKNMFYPSKTSSLYPKITKLLKTLDLFIQTYEQIHSHLYDTNGSVNRYFNYEGCKNMINKVWHIWDRQYFEFLHSLGSLNSLEEIIDTLTATGDGLGIFKDNHIHDKRELSRKNEEIGGGLGTGLAGEGRFKFDFNGYFHDSYNKRISTEFFHRLNQQKSRKDIVQSLVQDEDSVGQRNNAWKGRNGKIG